MEGVIPLQKVKRGPDLHSTLDVAFEYFFYAFVFVTIFLPSGSVYGINFKSPLYLGLLPLAVYSVFRRRQTTLGLLSLTLAVPLLLVCWVVLGLWHGFELVSAQRQYTDILLTLLMCWLASVFCGREEARRIRFLHLVLNSVIAAAVLKLGVIAYALINGIPVVVLVPMLSKIFGADLITLDLGSLYGRVQFISDELIPVCIFMVLRHRDSMRIGKLRASLTMLLLLTSVAFSFSRYFWGFAAFALVLGLLLGKRDKFQGVLAIVLGVAVFASLPALTSLYQLRFSGGVAGASDALRTEQIPALQNFFMNAPFLGNGLGSYTKQVVRGTTEAGIYSYEVQLLALPAQIGVIGMTFLIILGAAYYSELWLKGPLSLSDRIGIGLLLGFWIAAGFSNPLLFHPVAGVNYAALATLAAFESKTNRRRHLLL